MNATRLDEILRRYSDAKAREVEAYLARHPAEYRATVDPKPRPRRRSTALVAAVVAVAMIGSVFAWGRYRAPERPDFVVLRTPLGPKTVVMEGGPPASQPRAVSNFTTDFRIKPF